LSLPTHNCSFISAVSLRRSLRNALAPVEDSRPVPHVFEFPSIELNRFGR
jgi:predicted transcriptional regulator